MLAYLNFASVNYLTCMGIIFLRVFDFLITFGEWYGIWYGIPLLILLTRDFDSLETGIPVNEQHCATGEHDGSLGC